jgi:hypothetical protein
VIVTVSVFGETPIVTDSPTENWLGSPTGTSVEPFDAPGATIVEEPDVPLDVETGMTVQ